MYCLSNSNGVDNAHLWICLSPKRTRIACPFWGTCGANLGGFLCELKWPQIQLTHKCVSWEANQNWYMIQAFSFSANGNPDIGTYPNFESSRHFELIRKLHHLLHFWREIQASVLPFVLSSLWSWRWWELSNPPQIHEFQFNCQGQAKPLPQPNAIQQL